MSGFGSFLRGTYFQDQQEEAYAEYQAYMAQPGVPRLSFDEFQSHKAQGFIPPQGQNPANAPGAPSPSFLEIMGGRAVGAPGQRPIPGQPNPTTGIPVPPGQGPNLPQMQLQGGEGGLALEGLDNLQGDIGGAVNPNSGFYLGEQFEGQGDVRHIQPQDRYAEMLRAINEAAAASRQATPANGTQAPTVLSPGGIPQGTRQPQNQPQGQPQKAQGNFGGFGSNDPYSGAGVSQPLPPGQTGTVRDAGSTQVPVPQQGLGVFQPAVDVAQGLGLYPQSVQVPEQFTGRSDRSHLGGVTGGFQGVNPGRVTNQGIYYGAGDPRNNAQGRAFYNENFNTGAGHAGRGSGAWDTASHNAQQYTQTFGLGQGRGYSNPLYQNGTYSGKGGAYNVLAGSQVNYGAIGAFGQMPRQQQIAMIMQGQRPTVNGVPIDDISEQEIIAYQRANGLQPTGSPSGMPRNEGGAPFVDNSFAGQMAQRQGGQGPVQQSFNGQSPGLDQRLTGRNAAITGGQQSLTRFSEGSTRQEAGANLALGDVTRQQSAALSQQRQRSAAGGDLDRFGGQAAQYLGASSLAASQARQNRLDSDRQFGLQQSQLDLQRRQTEVTLAQQLAQQRTQAQPYI